MEEKNKWLSENNFPTTNIYDKMIVDACWNRGIRDAEQVELCIAISRFETYDYRSFVAKNNFGGMVNTPATRKSRSEGGGTIWYYWNKTEDGINAYVSNLQRNYFNKGLNTIEDIANIYAKDDPESNNILLNNPNWIPGVTSKVKALREGTLGNLEGQNNSDPMKGKTFDKSTPTQTESRIKHLDREYKTPVGQNRRNIEMIKGDGKPKIIGTGIMNSY